MNGLLSSVTPSRSVSTNSIMTNNGQLQQQNFFMPEKDEIWSGILKGVASSKMVPTKNVLILGRSFFFFLLNSFFNKKTKKKR